MSAGDSARAVTLQFLDEVTVQLRNGTVVVREEVAAGLEAALRRHAAGLPHDVQLARLTDQRLEERRIPRRRVAVHHAHLGEGLGTEPVGIPPPQVMDA